MARDYRGLQSFTILWFRRSAGKGRSRGDPQEGLVQVVYYADCSCLGCTSQTNFPELTYFFYHLLLDTAFHEDFD